MDAEDIARRVQALKLSHAKDATQVILPSTLGLLGRQRLEHCLVGKVFSSKAINRETFRTHMPKILQTNKTVLIERVGDNLFSMDFSSVADKNRALLDGPWHFFNDLVLFSEPQGLQNPNDMIFDEVPLWVQLYNLLMAFMHPIILRTLGERFGSVLDIDVGDRGLCSGKFAQIRISKKLERPLDKGIWVKVEDSLEESCILLLYERLPNFCFACGRVGHLSRDCEDLLVDKTNLGFGNYIRAPEASFINRSEKAKNLSSDLSIPKNQEENLDPPENSLSRQPSKEHMINLVNSDPAPSSLDDQVSPVILLEEHHSPLVLTEAGTGEPLQPKKLHNQHSEGSTGNSADNKMNGSSVPSSFLHDNNSPYAHQANKKWRRLARGSPVSSASMAVVTPRAGGKRKGMDLDGQIKKQTKSKHPPIDGVPSIVNLAEAAVQPHHSP